MSGYRNCRRRTILKTTAIRPFPSPDVMSQSVLVCDDMPAVQAMMRRMLERQGFGVSGFASTAKEVLERYGEQRPDVVLLDLNMPGATGLDLLRALRAFDPPARVVIVSGTADPFLRDEAHALGAADWVLKPVYGAALVALLREVLSGDPAEA